MTNLARFPKKQRYKTQINKIMNKRGDNATDTTRIQGLLRDYYKHLPADKPDNRETDEALETFNTPKLTQKEDHPSRQQKGIDSEIENVPKKSPGPDGFAGKF